jgi:threonine/homoserine/homoserine lactone efflux protein
MTLATLWLFMAMTFVISATPGPNMLMVMSVAARHGMPSAVMAMAGCMSALLAMMSISALGMGAVLQSSPQVFEALRLAGAAYLAFLGWKVWRSPVEPATAARTDAGLPAVKKSAIYRQAFFVAASNPKAILFAAAFFPQFIHAGSPQLPQFAILLATFTVIEVSWYAVYAASGQRLSVVLQKAEVLRVFNRVTGGAFIGFAAWMATVRD